MTSYPCIIGPSFQQHLIKRCKIGTSFHLIWAECSYPSNTMANGFQMLAHLGNNSEVHKLYTSYSKSPYTPAAVRVEESGVYQVTIFPIRQGIGIINSSGEYRELLMVNNMPTAGTFCCCYTICVCDYYAFCCPFSYLVTIPSTETVINNSFIITCSM